MRRFFVWLACAIAPGMAAACGDSPFGEFGETVGATITSGDTAVFVGSTTTFTAVAQYDIGPGQPQSIAWAVSDTAKVRLDVNPSNNALITARDTGQSNLVARINGDFLDTVVINVVRSGLVRWRRSLPAEPASHPALDDSGRVHVTDLNGNLWVLGPAGDTVLNVASCVGAYGPAVRSLSRTVTTSGTDCTTRHDSTGIVQWTSGIGALETAPAIAADAAPVVLSFEADATAGVEAVVVTRFSSVGAPLWRDTLVSSADESAPQSAPAIARNGDIYVTWRTTVPTYHLTRLSSAGVERWTISLPQWARHTTPAMDTVRVIVGHLGGIAAYDTSGAPLWSKTYPTMSNVSSPIIDRNRNVFVQTVDGLFSYAADGTLRWAADSLGAADAGGAVAIGAPTLLVNDDIVVNCGGAVCGVNGDDGSLQWRAAVSNVLGSAAINLDGQIYVTSRANEIIAIWGDRLPGFSGWPTEGGDQQRSRRRQ